MNYETLDDESLLRFISRSHPDALSELYDRYGRLIYSIALHLVGNRQTAEEVTLDVFKRVWQKANLYRAERASVRVWLSSMARYRAIDVLRRESVRPERHSIYWAELNHNPVSPHNSPEADTHLALQKERVRAAVATLPEEQKQALGLAYFGGYTHSEIAERLNLPLGTVKTRIRLALNKLRYKLQEDEIG
jgi:RNA polymerase sigma-70 factor, ECF subfamily